VSYYIGKQLNLCSAAIDDDVQRAERFTHGYTNDYPCL